MVVGSCLALGGNPAGLIIGLFMAMAGAMIFYMPEEKLVELIG
jgi:hypothetical protein